jgi:alkylation response protein AidB-like acyl-CoA dehydrogenase
MDYAFGASADELRRRLRRLVAEHLPTGYLGAFSDDPNDFELSLKFCKILAAEGLLCLAWPTEYGGMGAPVWEQTVVREEMWAHHEPRGPQYMNVNWIGPAIMRFGTEAQKAEHLPRITRGEAVWCQGFSEPDAGSDLGSLRTKAVTVDDGFRITGQKIWTSYANVAQHCFLAARTGDTGDRNRDITVFLLPMDREGITVRAIESMLGPYHLNEVFLDAVSAGGDDVLGELGDGWRVMREALAFERVGIARYARDDRLLAKVLEGVGWEGLTPPLRARYVRALVRARIARLLAYRVIDRQSRGEVEQADAATARIAAITSNQETAEVLMEALGARALDARNEPDAVLNGAVEDHWRYSQAATVAAGAIEIQKTLVARSTLGGTRR